MSHVTLRCPRCGAGRVPGWHCPNCGYGGEEPDPCLLGSPTADGVAAVVAGLVPLALIVTGFLIAWTQTGAAGGNVLVFGGGVLVLEVLAFFTVWRPYRTLRLVFSVVSCFSTGALVLLSGCQAMMGSARIMGSEAVSGAGGVGYVLVCVVLSVMQLTMFATAVGRTR